MSNFSNRMIIDAQALENLQVLEVSQFSKWTEQGSLLGLINSCSTKFGYWLLKRWVTAPLLWIESIEERLDSVEDLYEKVAVMNVFWDKMKKISDLEKKLSRLYKYSVNQN